MKEETNQQAVHHFCEAQSGGGRMYKNSSDRLGKVECVECEN